MSVPSITLNDGNTMPQLGFGVWQVDSETCTDVVLKAIEFGYRSIDTAMIYGNEQGVGNAVRECGLPREELFITTKLWSDRHDNARLGLEESLQRLGLDYVDMFLIHWPNLKLNKYVDAWKGLIECQEAGLAKSIGVSNFTKNTLEDLFAYTNVIPAVNQIELHPLFAQEEMRAFNASHGIHTEAWSPLGQGSLMNEEVLGMLASKYGKTSAQIVLRWHIELGNIVIPKSVTPARIAENFEIFDFSLDEDDMQLIATLNVGKRLGGNPETADW